MVRRKQRRTRKCLDTLKSVRVGKDLAGHRVAGSTVMKRSTVLYFGLTIRLPVVFMSLGTSRSRNCVPKVQCLRDWEAKLE